jgi:transketolase
MRNAFINTLIELAGADPRVALLMAEVGFSVVEPFEEKFPERFYNTGIAEQNLILVAAGMAMAGMRPVAYSMSCFLPSRAFEQIKVSVCYQDAPVTIVAQGAGMSYGELGPTHHATEESALMRSLPNMTVVFPADPGELASALRHSVASGRPSYVSFQKAPAPRLPEHDFEIGRAVRYKTGRDGVILAVGMIAGDALLASELLAARGLDVGVFGIHTVKPLDVDAIMDAASTGSVFVADEHQSHAGVAGDAARVILAGGRPVRRFADLSINDEFAPRVARYPELLEQYGLTAARMAERVASAFGRGA